MRAIRIARSVGRFWAGTGLATVIGGAILAALGPPQPAKPARPELVRHLYHGAIPPPNPKLLVASPANPAWMIPRQSGKTKPMAYYAAPAHLSNGLHRVAILVGGIGEALKPSLDAVTSLPPSVSLALTPYGPHVQDVAAAARKAGHETLLGLPMETSREPTVTEGDEALHGSELDSVNQRRLDWALSRAAGYAGVTDEIGMTTDETFLSQAMNSQWLGKHLQTTGLFMVTASRGVKLPPGIPGRRADVVIHPEMSGADQLQSLNQLAGVAVVQGSALGVISSPTASDIDILTKWCAGLKAQGLVLVPVSALIAPRKTK